MVYETFLKTIQALVQARLEGKAEVSLRRVLKNNGLLLDGLMISSPSSKMAPTVYLNTYYEEAEEGLPLSIITDQIMLLCEENPALPEDLEESLHDFSFVRERIVYKLINAAENELLLSDMPHYPYLDLAIVFYLIVSENDEGQMTALIHQEHLNMWNITKEELWQLAEKNTLRLLPCRITPIEKVLSDLDTFELFGEEQSDSPVHLYVLTNQKGMNGASCILYPDILKNFADQLEDDLYILPSSIHEVLLAPCSHALPLGELNAMVSCINQSDVPREDRLSDHIYCFSRTQNCLFLPSLPFPAASVSGGTENPQ